LYNNIGLFSYKNIPLEIHVLFANQTTKRENRIEILNTLINIMTVEMH
jgi:hypothetical protein